MSHPIDQLAAEYWTFTSTSEPTHAHLIGDYSRAARFEDVTRESEDAEIADIRDFVRRAGERSTTAPSRPAADHPRRAGRRRDQHARTSPSPAHRARGRPDLRIQVVDADHHGDARAARRRRSPRRSSTSSRGLGRYYGELAERQREGVASGRLPAAFAVADTVAQLDGLLATPVADDPLLTTTPPPDRSRRRRLEGRAAPGHRVRRTSRDGGLPRRAARRGAAPRAPRRPLRARAGCPTATRRTPRRCATTRPRPRAPRRSTTSVWRRSRSWPTSTARLGPEVVGTDDLRADLRGDAHRPQAPLRVPATSSSRPPRSRCNVRGTPCPTGSRCSRRPRARCRRR